MGMNIHLPAILGFTRYQGFDPSPHVTGWPYLGLIRRSVLHQALVHKAIGMVSQWPEGFRFGVHDDMLQTTG